jgi:choline dehydrogenase
MQKDSETVDFIVIGAGSAGCVLANRLSADSGNSVLLLEAGGNDRSIFIQMPAALSIPMNSRKYNWGFTSEPEPYLDGRRMNCPRGKVIGGSSSINGMAYVRGNAADFDGWAEAGATGWSYAEVLPYFIRAENRQEGGDDYRGNGGPLHTSTGRVHNPLYAAFIAAGIEAGYLATADQNGFQQEGFGRMDMTVHGGRRWSTANGYLKPVLGRKNLKVLRRAHTHSIIIENNRAVGVRYRRGDRIETVRTRREVVLAAGPIASPQILQLSGIGDSDDLKGQGIAVQHHLPGVGKNLQDHLELYIQRECTKPITLYGNINPVAKAMIGLRWLLFKDGLGASNHFEAGAFIRSSAGIPYPDIQYHFLPLAMSYDGTSLADRHGFQAHVGPMRSKSRGHVKLKSSDPNDTPEILFNYMSHPDDWVDMRNCVRLTREIFAQPAFAPFAGRELAPGPDVKSDKQIDAFIRRTVESAYHPCGTCRMGTDRGAVVDPQTRVHGIERLRVVDSSIFPIITTGNLNAPTIMVAEKAADMILGQQPLPPSNSDVFQAPNWQTAQR